MKNHLDVYEDKFKERRVPLIVFADSDRPGMKNIMEDFAWRRNHKAPILTEEEKKVIEYFVRTQWGNNIKIKSIKYDKHAGCSMCPCSPGFKVYLDKMVWSKKYAIWF